MAYKNIITGIYQIQSKLKPKRIYIGSASHIRVRWIKHKVDLNKNKHTNNKLQRHYNKYGKDDFVFSILITCNQEDLIKQEQFFIDALNPWFNICKIAGSAIGIKRSKEFKEKQRQRCLDPNNPWYSEESKEKRRKSLKGRTTWAIGLTKETSEILRQAGEKISIMKKGKKPNEEIKHHMSESQFKIWEKVTDEQREEYRQRMIGNKYAQGYKFTEEQRQRKSKQTKEYWERKKQVI